MTYQNVERMSISLPPDIARYIKDYQQAHNLESRSEAFVKAIQALREQELAEQYAALASENDPDRTLFLEGNTDGLEPSDGSEWL
ncbi:ribbon-helix-helix domain-containing protein [Deinococcus sp. SL84]|uniref:ribbon-helix-helix domain-containing protein n=1 Tax=Deinococcus sp. SL84 TaxID=2994663 RepID=UPI0022740D7B|nr:ribbon-helix-helix domain-containing protein [Deinococcus sp. SL84]MCY1701802.1 ribbon-helix-helix domain-containing protein [Deinococcus sp. SL84]